MRPVTAFITCFLFIFPYVINAQVESQLKKAENSIDRGNLREAITHYQKALIEEPENRPANLGLGLLYSELLDNYKEALPYLEKASESAVRDTSYDLIFALAKCYHYNAEFEKALSFYNRLKDVQDLEKETNFQKEINKRKADCEYARDRKDAPPDDNIYIVNAGKTINTDMPEYVPVLLGNDELLFTSKRQDDKKEELNYLDGKYYESMYKGKITANGFKDVQRYTLPDKLINSKFYKHNQAVVSLSQDGKKLFTFKDSKLYEINLDETLVKEPEEIKIKKFDHYQNHAFLTRDGNTLYFTSDLDGGFGGTDIYKSSKASDGSWARPENMGASINTSFDEDAPYITSDGTLYFASEGHEGFGNYDIYRSYFVENKWTVPENLGQPINSPGHDIFLVLDSTGSIAYFSSGRNGGFGDMDIYKIIYLDKFKKDCPPEPSAALPLSISDADTSDFKNKVVIKVPANYRILSQEWKIDGVVMDNHSATLENDYKKTGTFNVYSKSLAWCDTCLTPIISCLTIQNNIQKIAPLPLASKETPAIASASPAAGSTTSVTGSALEKNLPSGSVPEKSKSSSKDSYVELSAEELSKIGFNTNHILFDFSKSELRPNATEILKTNVDVLKKYPELYLEIDGYCDARGSKAANERISALRAKSVKSYLQNNGISRSRFRFTLGKGTEKLLNNCGEGVDCDESQHQQNRRVEFTITKKK